MTIDRIQAVLRSPIVQAFVGAEATAIVIRMVSRVDYLYVFEVGG